jgi:hypothetical protein
MYGDAMPRPLPTAAEAAAILSRKRTRPQHRPPPVAGRGLRRLLKDLDEKFGQGPGALQARWREIVGVDIAKRTEPVKLTKPRGGGPSALEIRVAGASAALIQHQAPEIVARVNLFLGAGTVNKLRIVQGPLRNLTGPATKPPRRRTTPLDAAQEAELAKGLADTPDGPLKTALLSLGRGVLRRHTG